MSKPGSIPYLPSKFAHIVGQRAHFPEVCPDGRIGPDRHVSPTHGPKGYKVPHRLG